MKLLYRITFFLLLLITQFSLLPRFDIVYWQPNLLLIVVVLFSLNNPPEISCLLAFGMGLLIDVNSGDLLGSNTFVMVQTAMLNTSLRKYLIIDSIPVQIMMTATSYLIASIVLLVLLRVAVYEEPASWYFLLMLARATVTALFVWPLSVVMFKYIFPVKTDYV